MWRCVLEGCKGAVEAAEATPGGREAEESGRKAGFQTAWGWRGVDILGGGQGGLWVGWVVGPAWGE